MGERPFRAYSVADLEAMTRTAWGDVVRLRLLADELRHRSAPRALVLRGQVEARLSAESPPRVPEGEDLVSLLLEIETLKARLEIARKEVEVQQFLVEGLKKELARSRDPGDAYARVFARPDIPEFALRALRAAFRREYHPDGKPEVARAEALEAYLAWEAVFDEIERLRARDAA
jgi:hypothetical protein